MPFRQQFERFIRLIAEDFVSFDLEFDCHIVLFLGRRLAWQTVEREPITFNTKSNFTPKQRTKSQSGKVKFNSLILLVIFIHKIH